MSEKITIFGKDVIKEDTEVLNTIAELGRGIKHDYKPSFSVREGRITDLELNDNQLVKIPETIGNLSDLETLNIIFII